MEFRLLGPLEALRDDEPLAVTGAKQRALLVLLLLHANSVVSRDHLLEELWGDRARDAGHSLDVQIARLRKALEPSELLVTRQGGYELRVEPEQIDVHRFERLLEEGRAANAAGRPAEAAEALHGALALWRGEALSDVAYESFARLEIERLEELRIVALEERVDADLALGHHHALVAELERLSANHPLRERLRGQLMLALYRSGRQAEALRVYADTRRLLVDELGLEPGQPLQQLEQAILRQDPSLALAAAQARTRRRRAALSAVGLAVAAGVATVVVLIAQGGTQTPHAQTAAAPDSVALLSAGTGKLVGQASARATVLARVGFGSIWSLAVDGELTRIDPRSGKVLATIGTGVVPNGIAVGAGSVWVTDSDSPTLLKIDPGLNVVTDRIPLPTKDVQPVTATGGVVVGAGSVWVGQGQLNPFSWVDRLDPATGKLEKRILIPGGAGDSDDLAFGDGALWVGGGASGNVTRVDPRTNAIAAHAELHPYVCCVAAGGGFGWAAISPDRTVWKIGADGGLATSFKLQAIVENITYAEGALWVADGDAGAVIRIDATTNARKRYVVGHHAVGLAVGNGLVAAGVQASARDVLAGVKGRVARVILREQWLNTTDPLFTPSWNVAATQLSYATCAKLFNYPDAAGPEGRKLEPELAAGPPTVSDDGRTYTFRIRSGYRFSPPSNEPVTAESMRYTLERGLSPKLLGRGSVNKFLADVVGVHAFQAGKAQHVAGLTAHGDTLVVRLVKPVPDLPRRLATTGFCAVPLGTPALPNGVPVALPSAGPYYVAAAAGDVTLVKPNPNYHGPRPRRLDAIVFTSGVEVGHAVDLVQQGKDDYVSEVDPALAADTPAARAAGPRYRLSPTSGTEYLALNRDRPLFSDNHWRRAVELGIDRSALASLDYAQPASDLLPPRLGGVVPGGYSVRPDLQPARKLTGDRRVHAVLAIFDPSFDRGSAAHARAVRQQLAAIGIDTTVLPLTFDDNDHPAKRAAKLARADVFAWQSDASYPDPVAYLESLPYLSRADRAALSRIATLSSPAREAAAAALAARLRQEDVYVVYADSAVPTLVSKRLGCTLQQPEYPGLDLAALCLRGATRG